MVRPYVDSSICLFLFSEGRQEGCACGSVSLFDFNLYRAPSRYHRYAIACRRIPIQCSAVQVAAAASAVGWCVVISW